MANDFEHEPTIDSVMNDVLAKWEFSYRVECVFVMEKVAEAFYLEKRKRKRKHFHKIKYTYIREMNFS